MLSLNSIYLTQNVTGLQHCQFCSKVPLIKGIKAKPQVIMRTTYTKVGSAELVLAYTASVPVVSIDLG